MTRTSFYVKSSYLLLCVAIVSIPFTRLLMLPLLILLTLCWLFAHPWCDTIRFFSRERLWIPYLLFCTFFLLHIVGTLYSENLGAAFANWDCKFWFLGAPILLFPLLPHLRRAEFQRLCTLFAISTLAVSIGNIVWSSVNFAQNGNISEFFYTHATHFVGKIQTHPSYLSMYACISWLIFVEAIQSRRCHNHKGLTALSYAGVVVLPIEIFLLYSKAGILTFILVILLFAVGVALRRKRTRWVLALSALLLTSIVGTFFVLPKSVNRIQSSIFDYKNDNRDNPGTGTMQRIVIWETSIHKCADNLLCGVGTGDLNDVLQEEYKSKDYTHIMASKLNCHNQYLQTTLTLGLIGLAAMLFWLIEGFRMGIATHNRLLCYTILIVAANLLVESMFEIRAGSNFIPLFVMLLWCQSRTTLTSQHSA